MKNELLIDLCGRLPYGVKMNVDGKVKTLTDIHDDKGLGFNNNGVFYGWRSFDMKPYLRPMSSMTKEEYIYLKQLNECGTHYEVVDFCNERYLDYRGLIEKRLALEAPKGMYKMEDGV